MKQNHEEHKEQHYHNHEACGCGHDHEHEACGCGHDHEHGMVIKKVIRMFNRMRSKKYIS